MTAWIQGIELVLLAGVGLVVFMDKIGWFQAKDATIQSKDATIQEKDATIQKKEAQIAVLQETVRMHEVAGSTALIERAQRVNEGLEKEVGVLQRQLSEMDARERELQDLLLRMQEREYLDAGQIANLQTKLDEVHHERETMKGELEQFRAAATASLFLTSAKPRVHASWIRVGARQEYDRRLREALLGYEHVNPDVVIAGITAADGQPVDVTAVGGPFEVRYTVSTAQPIVRRTEVRIDETVVCSVNLPALATGTFELSCNTGMAGFDAFMSGAHTLTVRLIGADGKMVAESPPQTLIFV